MTQLMQKALAEINKLSDEEQDSIAALILDELLAEQRWEQSLAESVDMLEMMANEALAEHHAGKTLPLNLVIRANYLQ